MGSINNSFKFGTVDSADYNLLVAGDGTFNAPERDVDTIEIPGRNGDLLIDKGRFKNITVEYTVYCYADDLETFRTQLRNFRNALSSQKGYQKLTDTFHPDEYRLGTFISGFEAEPVMFNTVAEVVLKFDCKPQRFLFSGEEVFTLGEWGETTTYSGSIASFDGTETTAIKSLKVNITPKQSGSGDPSPSNIRPISGWDAVDTNVTGVNIWDEEWEVGALNPDGGVDASLYNRRTTSFISVSPNSVYYYQCPNIALGGRYAWYSSDKQILEYNSDGYYTRLITAPKDARYLRLTLATAYGTTYNNDISINYPATDHEYHPYNGSTITTNLGQTVFGGTLDVVSGKLTIDCIITDTLDNYYWGEAQLSGGHRFFYTDLPNGIQTKTPKGWCSAYPIEPNDSSIADKEAWLYASTDWGGFSRIGIRDDDYTTIDSFKQSLRGVQLVFEVKTPTEIQLTPTEVNTLLGSNNIWADAGTIEVEVGENPNILVNPTPFESCPVFEVEGSGTLTVNNSSMTIANNGTTVIDSEMMEAYEEENGAIVSRNDMVSGEFPTLKEGNNNIGTVGLTSVKVTPKWWEV